MQIALRPSFKGPICETVSGPAGKGEPYTIPPCADGEVGEVRVSIKFSGSTSMLTRYIGSSLALWSKLGHPITYTNSTFRANSDFFQ